MEILKAAAGPGSIHANIFMICTKSAKRANFGLVVQSVSYE
jgi:hypothetical protein